MNGQHSRVGRPAARAAAWLGACIAALMSLAATAHAPELHGFKLVTFDRPAPAPDFTLARLEGGQAALADFRGDYVLLNFWATWCPPCLEEMPSMDALEKHFATRGFRVVAVSTDTQGPAVVRAFTDKLRVGFTILLDPAQEVATRYGASQLPVTFLLDREGRVIAAAQGARDWTSDEAISYLDENLQPR